MTTEPLRRVVVTGGPAAGKTAVLDVLRRHLQGHVAVLPEAATTLFQGGFPRPVHQSGVRLLQQTIYHVQHNLEEIYALEHVGVPHICDRGTLDGAAYWPGGLQRFLGAMGTSVVTEYSRYEAVLFLQTSAYDENLYPIDNPHRTESPARSRAVDEKLVKIWQDHPNYHFIGHEKNFYEKVAIVLIKLHEILGINHEGPDAVADTSPKKNG